MTLTLTEVTKWLHGTLDLAASGPQAQQAALDAVSFLAAPGRTAELLCSLRAEPLVVAACAARSYRHPLGFDRLSVIDEEPSFVLRVHVWWPDGDERSEHVHDHRFAFASAILRGGYEMQVFEQAEAGAPMTEFRERVSGPGADWQLNPVGPARLRLLSTTRFAQGTSYAIAADVLHRVVVPPGTLCLTLFLEAALTGSTTRVFAGNSIPEPARIPKQPLGDQDYLRRLDDVVAALTR